MKRLLALILAAMPLVAAAQLTVFTNEATFLASLTNPVTLTFTTSPVVPYSGSGYGFNVSTPSGLYANGTSPDLPGHGLISPVTNGMDLTYSTAAGTVTAVGGHFFAANASDLLVPGASISVTVDYGTAGTANYTWSPALITDAFLGFATTDGSLINSIVFHPVDGGNWAAMSSLSVGTASAVPEPSTYAAAFGACVLGLAAWRRHRVRDAVARRG